MKRQVQFISVLIVVGSICFATDTKVPSSHRSILQRLAHSALIMAVEENQSSSFTAVSFLTDTTGVQSVVRNDLINALTSRRISVHTNVLSADTLIQCSVQDPSLLYGTVFTESLFGARKVERTLSLTLQIIFSSQSNGAVFYSNKFSMSHTDTVLYSEIQNLDDESLHLKTLSQPQPSLFDSFLEPVIVTVASAVAIYLFFTIRS
ncbi:MAG: hypothetical protein AB1728_11575 [Bacteroidota bacterium]